MEKVSTLIVEDEAILAMDLAQRLTDLGYYVADTTDNGPDALTIVQQKHPDLVLFDINIRGEWDGVETARRLKQIRAIPFLFLTALTDGPTIDRARQVGPSAYIPKPFNDLTLRIAIDLAIHNFALSQPATPGHLPDAEAETLLKTETLLVVKEHLFIKQNYRFVKLRLSDVLFLQSDGNYTDILTHEHKYTLRLVLSRVIETMQTPDILRIHRSYAVNVRQVDSFSDGQVRIGKHTLPVGRSFREAFIKGFECI